MSVLSRSLPDTLLSERASDAFEQGWEIKTQEKEKVSVDLLTIIGLSSAYLMQGVSGITSVTKGLK